MELEWDADKAAQNLNKHGVSFEDAELIFYDTGRVETHDGREDYGEDRWATIGLAYSAVLYVVLHASTRGDHPPYLRKESQCQRKKAIP